MQYGGVAVHLPVYLQLSPHRLEDLADADGPREPEVHPPAILSLVHEAGTPQLDEVGRDRGGSELQHRRDLTRTQLPAAEHGEDAEPRRMGQRLVDLGRLIQLRQFVSWRNVVLARSDDNGWDERQLSRAACAAKVQRGSLSSGMQWRGATSPGL